MPDAKRPDAPTREQHALRLYDAGGGGRGAKPRIREGVADTVYGVVCIRIAKNAASTATTDTCDGECTGMGGVELIDRASSVRGVR